MNMIVLATVLARLIPYIAWGGAALATAAAGVYVNGRLKKSSRDLDESHRHEIAEDILDYFNVPAASRREAEAVMDAAMDTGAPIEFGGLREIRRIEASYVKKEFCNKVCRLVLVYCASKNGGTAVTKIERVYDHAYIPSAIRAEFIRTKRDRVTVLLYERKGDAHE